MKRRILFRRLALLVRSSLSEIKVCRARKDRAFAAAGRNADIDLVQAELARPTFPRPFEEEAVVEAQGFLGNVKNN